MMTRWSWLQRCTLLLFALSATACGHEPESAAPGGAAAPAKKVFNFYRREAFKTLDPQKQLGLGLGRARDQCVQQAAAVRLSEAAVPNRSRSVRPDAYC